VNRKNGWDDLSPGDVIDDVAGCLVTIGNCVFLTATFDREQIGPAMLGRSGPNVDIEIDLPGIVLLGIGICKDAMAFVVYFIHDLITLGRF